MQPSYWTLQVQQERLLGQLLWKMNASYEKPFGEKGENYRGTLYVINEDSTS